MHTATVDIINSSSREPILVSFSSPEVAYEPPVSKGKSVSPGKSIKMAVSHSSGTLNLFVWRDIPPNNIIWKGIVPTKIEKPLIVYPEKKEVRYMDIVLPSGFNPVTDVNHPGFEISTPKKYSFNKWWVAVIIGVILLVVLYVWCRKKKG